MTDAIRTSGSARTFNGAQAWENLELAAHPGHGVGLLVAIRAGQTPRSGFPRTSSARGAT
jgi:hypothetical protein